MSLSPEMSLVAVSNAIRYLGLVRLPAKTSLMSIKASWKTPLHQFQQRHNYSSFWNVFWCDSPCRRGISLENGCRNVPAAAGWGGGRQRDALTPQLGGCPGWWLDAPRGDTPPTTWTQPPFPKTWNPNMCLLRLYTEFWQSRFLQWQTKAKHQQVYLCWITWVSP